MAKIFRSLRQNMLSDKKMKNYLLYALGEIVLVMIGILLALQINNWNEERKAKSSEKILLTQLKEESSINLKDFEGDLAYRDTLYKTVFEFHNYLKTVDFNKESKKLQDYLGVLARLSSYEPADNYMKKYIASNTTNNSELTAELIALSENQKSLTSISEKAIEMRFSKFVDHLEPVIDFESLETTSLDKLKSLQFRNNIYLIAALEESTHDVFKSTLKQQRKVDSLLTQSLAE